MSDSANPKIVAVEEARRFMFDCFKSINVPKDHANAMADILVAADYMGHFSYGMNRLEMFIEDLTRRSTNGYSVPKVIKETLATAWVHGKNGLGAVVGNFCMDLAISKAKAVGIGWVCVKHSNHYGMAGWYSDRAMQHGLVGITMTNTRPTMVPTRSKVTALGSNAISLGAPAKNDQFLLDMATATASMGKVEVQQRKGEPIPNGWAQDSEGNETNDADKAINALRLFPLGGSEITSGYKGYGLSAMIEILCGVLSGANYATKIKFREFYRSDNKANLAHLFIAIDPKVFAPDFEERLADMNSLLRNCTPIDPSKPVLVPGDTKFASMAAIDKAGGIEYCENQLKACEELAIRLSVKPLSFNVGSNYD